MEANEMTRFLILLLAVFVNPSAYANDLHEHVTIHNAFGPEFVSPHLRSAVFSPDGKILVTASETGDDTIVWDPATGNKIAKLEKGESLWTIAISPDGSTLAGSTQSYEDDEGETWTRFLIWDIKTKKYIGHLKKKGIFVGWIAFSQDAQNLAAGGVGDDDVQIWNVKSGKVIADLKPKEETGGAWSLAFNGDGKSLVVGYGKGAIRVWDVASGRQTTLLKGHEDIVKAVAFDPLGKTILSAGKDKTVRKWDLANEKVLESFKLKDSNLSAS
jgi:WD40 repeat protein